MKVEEEKLKKIKWLAKRARMLAKSSSMTGIKKLAKVSRMVAKCTRMVSETAC